MKPWLRTALRRAPAQKSQGFAHSSQLVALQIAGRAHWTPRDYHALAVQGYQRNAVVYRCIRMIAEAAASVPLVLKDADSHKDITHLLKTPNPKTSRAEFYEALYGYLTLSGDAYIEGVLVEDRLAALYPLRPDRVTPISGESGWPIAWEYRCAAHVQRYRVDALTGRCRIHHMRLFHPTNDLDGFSPLEAAAQAVDVHNAGGLWTKSLLDNSARPSGALVYKGANGAERLSDEQFERLKSELENNHTGARAAGRPLLLEGGLDWQSMSYSPTDMDFTNARRDAARDIALAFGVPPMLLGIPGDNTYANYKEANLAFWRQTIVPLVRKTAQSLELWLSPWAGDSLDIAPDLSAISVFASEQLALIASLKNADFLSDDEKRERAGLPPKGGSS